MSPKKKYQLLLAAILALFIYLLPTEVWDRWRETWQVYEEVSAKEQQSPEKLAERKTALRARQQTLTSVLTKESGHFEQSQTGVVEFLSATARDCNVKLESLTPSAAESSGQIQEIGFSVRLAAGYHAIGKFVNALEQAGAIVRIRQIDIAPEGKSQSHLAATIDGTAYVVPNRR